MFAEFSNYLRGKINKVIITYNTYNICYTKLLLKQTNMKTILKSAVLFALIATFAGCVKDEGPVGPIGNTDLEHFTYTVPSNQWYTRGVFGEPGYQYYYQIDIPGITQSVMNYGAVMVYIKQDELFYPLPATANFDGYVNTIQNNVYLGMVEIFIEDTDFQTDPPGQMTFKVVVFDQLKSLPTTLDIKDYKQVEAYMDK